MIVTFESPVPNNILRPGGNQGPFTKAGDYEVAYIDDYGIQRFYQPAYGKPSDTLVIPLQRATIGIELNYYAVDPFRYLLRRGDTLRIAYERRLPVASLVNREAPPMDIGYETEKRRRLFRQGKASPSVFDSLAAIGQYRAAPMLLLSQPPPENPADFKKQMEQIQRKYARMVETAHQTDSLFLDSLLRSGRMSPALHEFYLTAGRYDLMAVKTWQGKLPDQAVFGSMADSLLQHVFYRKSLEAYFFNRYQVPMIKGANGSSPDFRMRFDSIEAAPYLSNAAKKVALFREVKLVIDHFSIADGQKYFERFKTVAEGDTALVNYLSRRYGLEKGIQNDLLLQNMEGEELAFSELLEKLKGQVVYVDFWASWCQPCRRAMPASRALKAELQSEKVAFLYLSIDDDRARWQTAAKEEGLSGDVYNFIITNRHTSQLLEDLEVTTIPRYLLYDREGKLVHKRAPGPGAEVNRLLKRH